MSHVLLEPNSKSAAAGTLTTGQYLTAIVLAITPSTLGTALGTVAKNPAATIADWIAAVPAVGDTQAVNTALTNMLNNPALAPIFTALLASQAVSAPDGTVFVDKTGNPVLFNFATLVKNIVWNNAGNLAVPWTNPPHPGGNDLLALINLLSPFQETS